MTLTRRRNRRLSPWFRFFIFRPFKRSDCVAYLRLGHREFIWRWGE